MISHSLLRDFMGIEKTFWLEQISKEDILKLVVF